MKPREFNKHLRNINKNDKSLEAIYNYYYGRIIMFINKNYKDGNNISTDVAQEFFIYIVKERKENKFITNPSAWIYTTCGHIALRMLKIERQYFEIDKDLASEDTKNNNDVFGYLEDFIKMLDSDSQKILRLMYVDGIKDMKEVAKMLNIKYDSVRQKHCRALKKLKKLITLSQKY